MLNERIPEYINTNCEKTNLKNIFLDRPNNPILLKGGNFKRGILSNWSELFLYCPCSRKKFKNFSSAFLSILNRSGLRSWSKRYWAFWCTLIYKKLAFFLDSVQHSPYMALCLSEILATVQWLKLGLVNRTGARSWYLYFLKVLGCSS